MVSGPVLQPTRTSTFKGISWKLSQWSINHLVLGIHRCRTLCVEIQSPCWYGMYLSTRAHNLPLSNKGNLCALVKNIALYRDSGWWYKCRESIINIEFYTLNLFQIKSEWYLQGPFFKNFLRPILLSTKPHPRSIPTINPEGYIWVPMCSCEITL